MEKILSIFIPSYNMEKYLNQCIDSLITDVLPEMEVLIINDGSKDNTLKIAREYETQYPESIKVIDKPNGNYGSCINAVLKVATGKYFKVLDADDSFEKENLPDFIACLKSTDADLVISNYVIVNEQGVVTRECKFGNQAFKDKELKECSPILYKPNFEMHAVTYKKEVFQGLDYVQSEGVSYTDMEWMFLPMTRVNTISFFDKVVYRYLVGRAGQTVDIKVSMKAVDQTMTVMEKLLSIYNNEKVDLSDLHLKYLQHRLSRKAPSIYRICLIKTPDNSMYARLNNFDERLRTTYPELYNELGNEDIKGLPFRFVKYWRKRYGVKERMIRLKLMGTLFQLINR